MTDLVMVVPSWGRAQAAGQLAEAFAGTCRADTRLVLAVDDDDSTIAQLPSGLETFVSASRTRVEALNNAGVAHARSVPAPLALGLMGDSHRPATVGWDVAFLAALQDLGTGVVYGDDGRPGRKTPTQCAVTPDLVDALGYVAPWCLVRDHVDDFWLDLGTDLGIVRYLPDVAITRGAVPPGRPVQPGSDGSLYGDDDAAYAEFKASSGWVKALARAGALL